MSDRAFIAKVSKQRKSQYKDDQHEQYSLRPCLHLYGLQIRIAGCVGRARSKRWRMLMDTELSTGALVAYKYMYMLRIWRHESCM